MVILHSYVSLPEGIYSYSNVSLGSLAHSQLAGFKSGSPHPGPRFCSWCPNTTSSGLPTPHSWGSTGSVPIGGTRGACHWGIAIHQVQCYQRPNVMRWAVRLGFPKNGPIVVLWLRHMNSEWLADGGWIVEPQTEEHHIPSKRTRVGYPLAIDRSQTWSFWGEAWGLYRSPNTPFPEFPF